MIGEAIDAALTIWQALLAWIAVGAVIVTAGLYAVGALLWVAGRLAWKALTRAYVAVSRTNTQTRDSRITGPAPEPAQSYAGPHDWKAAA